MLKSSRHGGGPHQGASRTPIAIYKKRPANGLRTLHGDKPVKYQGLNGRHAEKDAAVGVEG